MTTYTPTVWQDGDIITAQKLNKIENRIEEIQNLKNRILYFSLENSFSSSTVYSDSTQENKKGELEK